MKTDARFDILFSSPPCTFPSPAAVYVFFSFMCLGHNYSLHQSDTTCNIHHIQRLHNYPGSLILYAVVLSINNLTICLSGQSLLLLTLVVVLG